MRFDTSGYYYLEKLAALFYVFAITFAPGQGATIVKLGRLIIVLCAVCSIFKVMVLRLERNLTYFIWTILFLIYSGVSCVWASSRDVGFDSAASLLYVVITNLVLIWIIARDHDFIYDICKVIVWGGIAHGGRVFLLHGFTVYFSSRGGTDVESATILGYIAPLAAICAFILIKLQKTHMTLLYYILMLLNVIFALLSGSRKIFIYLGVFGGIYYIAKSKKPLQLLKKLSLLLLLAILVAIALLKIPALYNFIGYRFVTMISGLMGQETDGSTGFRMSLIIWGIDWFKQKPIAGYGIGNYKYLLGTTYDTWVGREGVYAHNNYIELLVDCGLIGTFLYYYLYLNIIVRFWKNRKVFDTYLLIAFSIVLTLMVTEYGQISYSIPFLQLILLIAWEFSTDKYSVRKE